VVIVRVVLIGLPTGVTVAGLKLQAAPTGGIKARCRFFNAKERQNSYCDEGSQKSWAFHDSHLEGRLLATDHPGIHSIWSTARTIHLGCRRGQVRFPRVNRSMK